MPTEAQRHSDALLNALAMQLCTQWQKDNPRLHGWSIDELSAFMAGVMATLDWIDG